MKSYWRKPCEYLFHHKLYVFLFFIILWPLQIFAMVGAASETTFSLADLPTGATPAVVAAMAKDLPEAYRLHAENATLSLANPAHNLEMTFSEQGSRIGLGGSQWQMRLTGFGYDGATRRVAGAAPVQEQQRLVYRYQGVQEWYVNSRWGIEQGFTVTEPPAQTNSGADLVVEMTLSGDISARLQDGVVFLKNSLGQQLRYSGLQAFDAAGRTLPARLALEKNTLRILVDDSEALYPVTIDPWLQSVKLTASDGEKNDFFGASVAMDGETMVISALGDDSGQGSVYIFEKPFEGWGGVSTFEAKLTAADGEEGDGFGVSIAIEGDTVVIGAAGDDNDQGSAYIFTKPSDGWQTTSAYEAKLTAADGEEGDGFGASVAIDNDTVVIGALGDADGIGLAYVYTKPDDSWVTTSTFEAKFTFGDDTASADAYQGASVSVAIDDDTIVVGGRYCGAVYLFLAPEDGWTTTDEYDARLLASDGESGDYFGSSLAIAADTVVIGAYENSLHDGAAYIFVEPDGGWKGEMTETAELTSDGENFGAAVAIAGDMVAIGTFGYEKVYAYLKPDGGWQTTSACDAELIASDNEEDDYFGLSLAVYGNTVAAGAFFNDADFGEGAHKGATYIYHSAVFYDDNGSASGFVPVDFTDYAVDDTVTVLDNSGSLEKSGYIFGDWNTAADGSGTAYSAGDEFSFSNNITLYAQWIPLPATIIYRANGSTCGSVPVDATEYVTDDTVTVLGNTGSLEKSRYTFVGWNTAADGTGMEYHQGESFTITGDVTLYAQWQKIFPWAAVLSAVKAQKN